ncbi:hypothetical protein ACJZ2D_001360 [Fusarium nematophilum]
MEAAELDPSNNNSPEDGAHDYHVDNMDSVAQDLPTDTARVSEPGSRLESPVLDGQQELLERLLDRAPEQASQGFYRRHHASLLLRASWGP